MVNNARRKANWFDWIIYRLFWWRWQPILQQNDELRKQYAAYWNSHWCHPKELLEVDCEEHVWLYDPHSCLTRCRKCGSTHIAIA